MSIQPNGAITSEQRGYRRGLILGLTMAESMLLLVFCLLLAAGAILIQEREKLEAVRAEKNKLTVELVTKVSELEQSENELSFLQEALNKDSQINKNTVDEWRELIFAKKQLDVLEQSSLKLTEVIQNSELIKAVLEQDITADEIQMLPAFQEVLASIRSDNEMPIDDKINDISEVLKKLLTLHSEGGTSFSEQLDQLIHKASFFSENEGTDMPHEWPPIINLSEADRHFFKSGSAELSASFEEVLVNDIAEQIAKTATRYAVDVIEVIGHTDEQRMGRRPSNLDDDIKSVLLGKSAPSSLQPADNAGLGLARALAVSQVLKRVPNLKQFTILPMSGAQLILPGDLLSDGNQMGDTASRRRIEIRVRKRNDINHTNEDKLNQQIVN